MKEIEIGNIDTYPEFKEEESLDLKMEEPFNPSDINISSKQDTLHNLHITLWVYCLSKSSFLSITPSRRGDVHQRSDMGNAW